MTSCRGMSRRNFWRHAVAFVFCCLAMTGWQGSEAADAPDWRAISLDQSDVDIPLLLPEAVTVSRLERATVDNLHTVNRYTLDGNKGNITQFRLGSGTVFSENVKEDLLSPNVFEKQVRDFFKEFLTGSVSPQYFVVQGWKIGQWAVVDTKRGQCLFTKTGYRIKGPEGYRGDESAWNATLNIFYCAEKVSIDMFTAVMSKLQKVEDRAEYSKALIVAGRLRPPAEAPKP